MMKRIISAMISILMLVSMWLLVMMGTKAADDRSLYRKILERDGFIYGVNVPWFTSDSYGRNIGSSSRNPGLGSAFSIKNVREVFRNCHAIGFNAVRIRLFEQMEGLQFDSNGSITGFDSLYLENLKSLLKTAREEKITISAVLQPGIGYSLASAEYKGSKTEYDIKTQSLFVGTQTDRYLQNIIKPVCELFTQYADVILAVEVCSKPEEDVQTTDYRSFGTTHENMDGFLHKIINSVRNNLPNVAVSIESGLNNGYQYNDWDIDTVGVNVYGDYGDVPSMGLLKVTNPVWISEFGALSANNMSDDFQMHTVTAFYRNAREAGYTGAFYWMYGFADANGNGNSLINPATGEIRPVVPAIRFGILNNSYERSGVEMQVDKPSVLYSDDFSKINWIGSRNAEYYSIERSDGNNSWKMIADSISAVNVDNGSYLCKYSDNSTVDGITYTYRITAVTSEGYKAVSEPSSPDMRKVVCLPEENLMVNPSFETGDSTGYEVFTSDFKILTGTAGIQSRTGVHSAYMGGAHAWTGVQQIVPVKPNTDYICTVYIKTVSAPDKWGGYFWVIRGDEDFKQLAPPASINLPTNVAPDWYRYTLDFNSGDLTSVKVQVINGGCEQYVDDFYLFEADNSDAAAGSGEDVPVDKNHEPERASYYNLVKNQGFETGNITGYETNIPDNAYRVGAGMLGGGVYAGQYSLFINATALKGEHMIWQQIDGLAEDTDYTCSLWLKSFGIDGASPGYMQIFDTGDRSLNSAKAMFDGTPAKTWKKYTIKFNSADMTSVVLKIANGGYNQYIDQICVYETYPKSKPGNLVINPGFETGQAGEYNVDTIGSFSVVKGVPGNFVHSGDYAANIKGVDAWKAMHQFVRVKKNSDYTLSVWVKLGAKEDGRYGGYLLTQTLDYSQLVSAEISSMVNEEWQQYTVTFNSGENDKIYISIVNGGRDQYIDDLFLEGPKPEPASNLMENSGFETGDMDGYWSEGDASKLSVVTGSDAHSGTYALKLSEDSSWGYPRLHQTLDVKPNSEYTLSVWMKFGPPTSGKYSGSLRVDADPWAEIKVIEPVPGDGWKEYTINFNSGTGTRIVISVFNGGLDQYVDDFCLEGPSPNEADESGSNLILNSGFETGDMDSYWTEGDASRLSIVTGGNTHSGTYALKLSADSSWGYPRLHQYVDVKPNSNYTLSVWMKFSPPAEGKYSGSLRVAAAGSWSAIKDIEPAPGDGWQKYTISFNSGANNKIVISVFNGGLDQYVDDFCLEGPDPNEPDEPAEPEPNLMNNSGFETGDKAGYWTEGDASKLSVVTGGNAHSGTYALKLSEDGGWGYPRLHQYVDVKPNSDYTLSVWMKFSPPAANKYSGQLRVATESWGQIGYIEPAPGDGWQKYTLSFNSGANNRIVISVFNGGLDQYVDDFYLDGPNPK